MFLGYLFFCACKHACIPEWRHSDSQLLSTFSFVQCQCTLWWLLRCSRCSNCVGTTKVCPCYTSAESVVSSRSTAVGRCSATVSSTPSRWHDQFSIGYQCTSAEPTGGCSTATCFSHTACDAVTEVGNFSVCKYFKIRLIDLPSVL